MVRDRTRPAIQSATSSIMSVARVVTRYARRSGRGVLSTVAPAAAIRRESLASRGSSTPPAWTPGNITTAGAVRGRGTVEPCRNRAEPRGHFEIRARDIERPEPESIREARERRPSCPSAAPRSRASAATPTMPRAPRPRCRAAIRTSRMLRRGVGSSKYEVRSSSPEPKRHHPGNNSGSPFVRRGASHEVQPPHHRDRRTLRCGQRHGRPDDRRSAVLPAHRHRRDVPRHRLAGRTRRHRSRGRGARCRSGPSGDARGERRDQRERPRCDAGDSDTGNGSCRRGRRAPSGGPRRSGAAAARLRTRWRHRDGRARHRVGRLPGCRHQDLSGCVA